MVAKIMQWVSITALLLTVTWRPSASHQLPLDFVVCTGVVMVILTLLFIKRRIGTHGGDGFNPARRVTVKL